MLLNLSLTYLNYRGLHLVGNVAVGEKTCLSGPALWGTGALGLGLCPSPVASAGIHHCVVLTAPALASAAAAATTVALQA